MRVRRGERAAAEELFFSAIPLALRLLDRRWRDNPDIFQDMLVYLWKNIYRYQPSRGRFSTFAYRVLLSGMNSSMKQHKRQGRKYRARRGWHCDDPLARLCRQEETAQVARAWTRLKPDQREIIVGRCCGRSFVVLAKGERSSEAARTYFERALAALRREMGDVDK